MTKKTMQALGVAALVLAAGLSTSASAAQVPVTHGYGAFAIAKGRLQSISQLPPGQLRRSIEALSSRAQANALRWLQRLDLSGADLDQMRVDAGGGVYVADTLRPDTSRTLTASKSTGMVSALWVDADAFQLHSKPGAPNVVYLDFNGHTFSGTAWGSGASYSALAYSADADRSTFSSSERAQIIDIWHRVAEDLAPFDIDVTTQEPASFGPRVGRVLITEDQDANGVAMPSAGAGGVAYVNVFGASNYASYYSPALVYADNLGPNVATYIAEASSHEFGHNLGLSHDGTTAGVSYYGGQGTGLVSWAPIMGNSYSNNVTEWSKGEYANANQTQDDLAIIAGKLGYKPDDHGNTIASGTALAVAADGTVDASNPELDPYNLLPQNKGVIGSAADEDVFTFTSGAGPLTLTVTPAWDAFYRATTRRGANLDVQVQLLDNAGNVLATGEPNTDTMGTVSATVAAGTYHLRIGGVGNAVTPYSDYASLGQYFINGSVTPGTADTTAPTPNPMAFAVAPAPTGQSSIAMTAATATDETSAVQYRFNCVAGGGNCVASAWQSSPAYSATGLDAATQYSFTVQARDAAGNTTAASPVASATTDTPPPPPPFVDVNANTDTVVVGSVSGSVAATTADDGVVQAITEVDSGGKPASRYSTLEHRWNFSVPAGQSATLVANAWSSGSTDGDVFNVQVSTNGGQSWSNAFTVSSTSNANVQSAVLAGPPSGAVIVRVVDSNRVAGNRQYNTFSVDRLYIQVANGDGNPPDGGPSGLSASAVSSSRIDLAWTDGAGNEAGYRVERSADGLSGWAVVAQLPINSQAYSDTGLQAATSYFYRVSAYNANGSSAFANASATTPAAPPPSLSLSATGSRSKGVSSVALSWSGSSNVDVYRNGAKVASSVAGSSYTDTLGKVTGTFTHQVCAAGSTTACSNTTTTTF